MSGCAIVIPAFNEQETIGGVVRDLAPTAPVIVVDDASTDGTAEAATTAGAIVVRLGGNCGYGHAVDAGFREAVARGFRYVVTADGDGQHDAGEVSEFVRIVSDGEAELAIGIRPHTLHFVERICAWYARAAFGVRDPLCGLKAYDLRFYEDYGGFDQRRSVGTELMTFALRRGARWTQRPITLHERRDGTSRFYTGLRANVHILRSLWALLRVR